MITGLAETELSERQFHKVKDLLYSVCGINLQPGKEGLVKARLSRRLRSLNLNDYDAYLSYVKQDESGRELSMMVDALTTNKTDFFREPQHFDFLRQSVLPGLAQANRPLRFWSAACSSGEEPYSLAIQLFEALPNLNRMDAGILATDISSDILKKARRAVYTPEVLQGLSEARLRRYFARQKNGPTITYQVHDQIRNLIHFARLNLMQPWPMKGPFDVIFCRNVMIYFDQSTRQQLIQRFYELLRPGGYLFIGHSESLTGIAGSFRYIQPATYLK